jgi:hypothetical protein
MATKPPGPTDRASTLQHIEQAEIWLAEAKAQLHISDDNAVLELQNVQMKLGNALREVEHASAPLATMVFEAQNPKP